MEHTIEITIKPARLIPDSFIVFVTSLCAEGRYIEAFAMARIEWPTLLENLVWNLNESVRSMGESMVEQLMPSYERLCDAAASFSKFVSSLNLNDR